MFKVGSFKSRIETTRKFSKYFEKKTFFFIDIDGTLYPNSKGVNDSFDIECAKYVSKLFNVSFDEGLRIRIGLFNEFGSTYSGLFKKYGLNIDYIEYINEINKNIKTDHLFDKETLEMIKKINREEVSVHIFSNAAKLHVSKVLKSMKMDNSLFDTVTTVEDLSRSKENLSGKKLIYKPMKQAFSRMLEIAKVRLNKEGKVDTNLNSVYFADDVVKNIKMGLEMNLNSILIDESGSSGGFKLSQKQLKIMEKNNVKFSKVNSLKQIKEICPNLFL